ncbi:hypothetical protein RB653_005683 [Dictyostelium firmibasis]|uniref:Uncharacterized protein n=1 Tax=Dictyostelium firmibasis TaxID=79012 RepID=A0AAN7YZH0_9MYCE
MEVEKTSQNESVEVETIDDLLKQYKVLLNQFKTIFPEIVEIKENISKSKYHPYKKNNHVEENEEKEEYQEYQEFEEYDEVPYTIEFQLIFNEIQDIQLELFDLFQINIEVLQC